MSKAKPRGTITVNPKGPPASKVFPTNMPQPKPPPKPKEPKKP